MGNAGSDPDVGGDLGGEGGIERPSAGGRDGASGYAGTSGRNGASGRGAASGHDGVSGGDTGSTVGRGGTSDDGGAEPQPNAGHSGSSGAGQGGQGGGSGGSVAGSGGDAARGGEAGGVVDPGPPLPDYCDIDQPHPSDCISNPAGQFWPITLGPVQGIGIATDELGHGFHFFASRTDSLSIGVNWGDLNYRAVGWCCFEQVLYPDRVAATVLTNDFPEVFVTTKCGKLYGRRKSVSGWDPWRDLSLPADDDSVVRDVAMSLSPSGITYIYVVDRGRVFARRRENEEPAAVFRDWWEVGPRGARLVAAGLRPDGRQQVFTIDAAGASWSCTQNFPELDSPFAGCMRFGSPELPPLIDIEVPYHVDGKLPVFGLDVRGVLWQRTLDVDGEFGPWQPFSEDPQPVAFTALASGGDRRYPNGGLLRLVAVGNDGIVYGRMRRYGAWEPWTAWPDDDGSPPPSN